MKIYGIKMEEIYEGLSEKFGFSIEEIKQILQQTLNEAYENPTKEQKKFQDIVPRKGKVPTFEEFAEFYMQCMIENDKTLFP